MQPRGRLSPPKISYLTVTSYVAQYGDKMLYNVCIKRYPDGTVQYKVYDRYIECDNPQPQIFEKRSNPQCVEKKEYENLKRAKSVVYDLCRSNEFFWFFTLTFDSSIDSYDYEQCVYQLKRFTKWLGKCGVRYIFVPEQHESGRYHFHGLVGAFPVSGSLQLRQAYNSKTGKPFWGVWNIESYKFGFSTCSVIRYPDKVSSYLTKYLTKDMVVPKGCKRYWCSSGLLRPQEYKVDLDIDERSLMFDADFSKVVTSDFGGYRLYEIHKKNE